MITGNRKPSFESLSTNRTSRAALWYGLGAILLVVIVAAGWLAWRFLAPVEVHLTSNVNDLPFEVQVIPPVVQAHPGEMVNVVYRIHNKNLTPLEAFGKIQIEPSDAADQIKIYLTQCGGLNTFQNSVSADYQVYFRVQPAGLTGAQAITVDHIFTRAAPASVLP